MKFTWDLMTFYGYKEADFLGVNYATGDIVNPLEEGSLYYRALKVNNQLYRMGLFDPESVSQNFDTYLQKLSSGRYLVACGAGSPATTTALSAPPTRWATPPS